MGGWTEFLIAGFLFMGSHAIPSNKRLKNAIINAVGQAGWVALFSTLSTVLLFWVIFAATRAPYVELWPQETWMRWLANIVMPVAVALGSFGVAAPNPFAFEGRAAGYDPEHPGIVGLVRQPLLWALALWGGVHLLVNGDLAHLVLFGVFVVFSLVGMRAMEARKRRDWGEVEFTRLATRTSGWPLQALLTGRWRPIRGPSLLRLAIAVLAWMTLWHLHAPVIGVSPFP
ncbi:NnrU family protein [Thioclava sp. A2]|uniref:NnrU family protein n=1 Tax=Thioclava sp. FCG-A2 TaxID=3080562 RepID=UPI002955C46B|nr:NnrU family protein [Thioclava sp. A2]MDV7270721.1 NnrU family protein [Thioclava sp. A2]